MQSFFYLYESGELSDAYRYGTSNEAWFLIKWRESGKIIHYGRNGFA